jgi:hypothetical protein
MSACLQAGAQAINSNPRPAPPATISAVQEFAKTWGFRQTKNFRNSLPQRQAYFLCYSTGILQLPNSYDGLRMERASESGCLVHGSKRDLLFYPVEALADHAKTTSSLVEASEERRVMVVAHEDFHAVTHAFPAPIAESAAALVGFLTAAEFARAQFGQESDLYRNLSGEAELFLRKANLIKTYHARLRQLYASGRRVNITTAAALVRKQQVFEELGRRCKEILPEPRSFNRCPAVLNNAGLAFDMTYADYYPLLYQMYLANGRDLKLTIGTLKQLATGGNAAGRLKHLRSPLRSVSGDAVKRGEPQAAAAVAGEDDEP